MSNKRTIKRSPNTELFDFSVSVFDLRQTKQLRLKGRGIDLSDEGIGFQTDYSLEPGHVLMFHAVTLPQIGVVKWTRRIENCFRIGVSFI
jgi:hypothetical protein